MLKEDSNIEAIFPLTSTQKGMFFESINDPDGKKYSSYIRMNLDGEINISELKNACQVLIDNIPNLRSAFVWKDGKEPFQICFEKVKVPFLYRQIKCDAEAVEILQEEYKAVSNLKSPPYLRMVLFKKAIKRYEFIFIFNHLILDGWSVSICIDKIFKAYLNREVSFESNNGFYKVLPYMLESKDSKYFWEAKFKSFAESTTIDFINENTEDEVKEKFASKSIYIDEERTKKLRKLSYKCRVSLNHIIQAVWAILLGEVSNCHDVVYGSVFSGRSMPHHNIGDTIGMFINTLPMRINVRSDIKLIDLFTNIRNDLSNYLKFEHTPLPEINKLANLKANMKIFKYLYVYQDFPNPIKLFEDHSSDLRIKVTDLFSYPDYPLTFVVGVGTQLELKFIYDNCIFNEFFADTVLNRMAKILNSIDEVNINEHIYKLSGTFPNQETHESEGFDEKISFLKALRDYPQKIAISNSALKITYQQLDRYSNSVAKVLQNKNINYKSPIGILCADSCNAIISMFGVLKSGNYFIPIDIKTPSEKIKGIIKSTNCKFLITDVQSIYDKRLNKGIKNISFQNAIKDIGNTKLKKELIKKGLSYIICTSGSTGTPKAVINTNKGLNNLIDQQGKVFNIDSNDVVCLFSSLNFDASISEIFVTLCNGAELFLIDANLPKIGDDFIRYLIRNKVNSVTLPTAFLRTIEDYSLLKSFKTLVIAGEIIPKLVYEKILKHRKSFINAYGLSEASVCSTYSIQDKTKIAGNIGKPLINQCAYILNSNLNIQVPHCLGKIYLSGHGLSIGYANNSALSAEDYRPNSINPYDGNRIYDTGDWGYYDRDGNLNYHCRSDDQTKIQGIRFNPNEIDDCLSRLKQVHSSYTFLDNDEEIVTFVKIRKNFDIATSELVKELRKYFIGNLLPSQIILVEDWPLNINGKIDKIDLMGRINKNNQFKDRGSFSEDNSTCFDKVKQVWADVLNLSSPSEDVNFFDLGGDSFKLIALVHEYQRRYQWKSTVNDLFNNPRIIDQVGFFSSRIKGRG